MGKYQPTSVRKNETPSIESMKIFLDDLVLQGELSPEEAEAILLDPSAFGAIVGDVGAQESQTRVLNELQDIIGAGGLDAQGEAALAEALGTAGTAARGRREALMDAFRQRGASSSGFELASLLSNEQAAADQGNQAALKTAADAEARRMAALGLLGQEAGDVRQQSFSEAAKKASAADAFEQWNKANRQQVQTENVNRRNEATEKNLGERQRVADTNVATGNQQEIYNKELLQRDFDNRMARVQANIAAKGLPAGTESEETWSAIGGTLQGLTGGQMSDERSKTGISPISSNNAGSIMKILKETGVLDKGLSKIGLGGGAGSTPTPAPAIAGEGGITGGLSEAAGGIGKVGSGITETVGGLGKAAGSALGSAGSAIGSGLSSAGSALGSAAGSAGSAIGSGLGAAGSAVGSAAGGAASGISSAIGALAALFSDEDTKENKKPVSGGSSLEKLTGIPSWKVKDALGELKPSTYEYKEDYKGKAGAPPGKNAGLMAQDLQAAGGELAESVSKDGDGMRKVDYQKLTPSLLALLTASVQELNSDFEAIKKNGRKA